MSRRVDVGRLLDALGVEAVYRGDEWEAPCPVHEDTDPSWHMSDGGSWYCFGCTRGGGPADLVKELLGLDLAAAIEWIETRGLYEDSSAMPAEVRIVVGPGVIRRRPCTMPPEVRQRPFEEWPTPVRRYVLSRGISPSQVERWRIGYALQGQLAGRIVMPIEDENGVLRSWMARAFDDSGIRYLTPKTDADRGAVFGQRFWPAPERRREATLFVTEGGINALVCELAGAEFVGALGGSNTKYASKRSHSALEQVAKISTFGRIVIVSDPDGAGERVARALYGLSRHLDVARAELPAKTDAADLARKSLDELRRVLCRAGSLRSAPPSDTRNARA